MEWSREVGMHGMKCLERVVKVGKKDEEGVLLGVRLAEFWKVKGRFGEAMRAMEMGMTCLGDEECVVAAYAFGTMGELLISQGQNDLALQSLEQTLTVQQKCLSRGHPDTGITFNNMAIVFHAQGSYIRALEYYERVLAIREESPRESSQSVVLPWLRFVASTAKTERA